MRIRTLAAVTAAAALITPLTAASAGADDREYPDRSQDVRGAAITPASQLTGTETNGDATFGTGKLPEGVRDKAKTVDIAAGETIRPRLDASDNEVGVKELKSTWCQYRWKTKVKGKPPIDNLYRYGASKVRKSGSRQASQLAHDAQGGFDAPKQTTTTRVDWSVPIEIPDDWPQPSQISGWANPTFKGAVFVNSNYYWWGGNSGAGAQQQIRIGIARDNDTRWRTLHDLNLESTNGTEETVDYQRGIDDGDPSYANIDTTPDHTYTFKVRSKSLAWSDPVTGAGAQGQVDFNGDIDAPGNLVDGGYVRPDGPFDTVLIQYKAPKEVKCQ